MRDLLSLLGRHEYDHVHFFIACHRPSDISTSVDGFVEFLEQIPEDKRDRVFLFFTNVLFKNPETLTISVADVLANVPIVPVSKADPANPASFVYKSIYEDVQFTVRRNRLPRSIISIDPWRYYRIQYAIEDLRAFCLEELTNVGLKNPTPIPIRPNMNPYDVIPAALPNNPPPPNHPPGPPEQPPGPPEQPPPPPEQPPGPPEQPLPEDWEAPPPIGPATDDENDENGGEEGSGDDYVPEEEEFEMDCLLGRLKDGDRVKIKEKMIKEKPVADINREFEFDGDLEKIRYGFIFIAYGF